MYKCFNELSNHRPICELKRETDLGLPTTLIDITKDSGLIWFAFGIVSEQTNNFR